MKKINPLYLFFILVYANEGLYHLPGQAIYYLTRELWKLDATTMGWIAFISGLPWCIKILFGFIGDKYPSKIKAILISNYVMGILAYLYIIIFGLTPISLTITGFLISFYVAFSDTLNDKNMVVVEQDGNLQGKCQCFDEETEILTNNGWKNIHTINYQDKALSLDLNTKTANYYKITKIFKYNYQGFIYRVKNETLNFIFSLNHRLLYKRESQNNYEFDIIENVFTKQLKNHTSFLQSFKWDKKDQETFIIDGIVYSKNNKIVANQYTFKMDDWCQFLGWYLSEGCFFERRTDNQISITQTKIQNLKEIEDLLSRLGLKYWKSKTEFFICSETIKNHLKKTCYLINNDSKKRINSLYICYNKCVPQYIKNLSSRQISIFLDAFNKGDGWRRRNEFGFCTTSKQLSDDLQELILKSGHAVSYKTTHTERKNPLYVVHSLYNKNASFDVSKNITKENYSGLLWDIETKPHHSVFIRRDGRAIWTGNSMQWSSFGVVSVLVSIFGAMLATAFPATIAIKIGYSIALSLPIITLIYFFKYYKAPTECKAVSFQTFKSELKLFKSRNFLTAILFIAFLMLSPSFGTPLMIYARETLHVNKMFLGYLGATGEVLSIVGYLIYYRYCQKFDLFKMLQFMIIGTVITNLFYLYIPNQWFLLAYNIAFGAFNGMSFLILLNFFVQLVPKNSEGFFYACLTGISNLCGNGSAVLGGYVFDHAGYSATVIVASATTACCLFIIPLLKRSKPC